MSLTESSLTRTNAFVGLANYHTLLNDPSFWDSVCNTFYFALLTVIPLTRARPGDGAAGEPLRQGPGLAAGRVLPAFRAADLGDDPDRGLDAAAVVRRDQPHPRRPAALAGRSALGACRRWPSAPSGGRSASTCCCSWPACATSRPTCTKRRRWTARAASRCSASITWPALRPVATTALILQIIASLKVFGQTYILTSRRALQHHARHAALHVRDRIHPERRRLRGGDRDGLRRHRDPAVAAAGRGRALAGGEG